MAAWTGTVLETYAEVLLTRAGARSVLLRPLPLVADGQVHAVSAVKWQCECTWK